MPDPAPQPADPLWYKDAVIYEVHVRAFADGNADGIGDFVGLTQKLDFIQDLGVTAVWLLPFYPSPLRDDGYDIADYTSVHPNYGSLDDFKTFLDEAHKRNLRVITELVVNHTSDQHPWFQRARRAKPGSVERDFYVWSDSPEKYRGVRIIFQDFEPSNWSWDPLAKAYFWHRFYGHQPDLNYDNPAVPAALEPVVDFWLDLGVDGMRLDAVPYLYEREGTSCENLPETHTYLKKLRQHISERYPDRMLLAEANQWPEDAVAYFGDGDECHMCFHFPVMPRMFMALRMEDRFPIVDIMQQTPAIPDNCQWAMFLRNHDELTLEMVTDEERDYMYRTYASDPQARINLGIRRRLAPLLGNDRRRIELMLGLLCALPGTPVLYYGDEIGMGDNFYLGDRNGVRTPMQWSGDRNAGFSRANPQKLFLPVVIDPEYHFEALNVEAQQNNPSALLWWVKRLLAARKRTRAFGRGTLAFLQPDNYKVLAFVRQYGEERILVVANLSRFAQHVDLNLAEFPGFTLVEMFGQTEFPAVADRPYPLTLGPHGFYWFRLAAPRPLEATAPGAEHALPAVGVAGGWEDALRGAARPALEALLPAHLASRSWFRGVGRTIKGAELIEAVAVPGMQPAAWLTGVRVDYAEGDPELYLLPLARAAGEEADALWLRAPRLVVARLLGAADGLLYDATYDADLNAALLKLIAEQRWLRGTYGTVQAGRFPPDRILPPADALGEPQMRGSGQNRAESAFADKLLLTLYRRLEAGPHPDWEVGRHLAAVGFPYAQPLAGGLHYRPTSGEPLTFAVLQEQVPAPGDGWHYTLDALSRFAEAALSSAKPAPERHGTLAECFDAADADPPTEAAEMMHGFLEWVRVLGRRTAELHVALATDGDDPAFTPEPFSALYQRSVYQSLRNRTGRTYRRLGQRLGLLPPEVKADAQAVLDRGTDVLRLFRGYAGRRWGGVRTRTHGDLHLAQVLVTGNDVAFTHFGGDRVASPSERRQKQTPLRDVAGLLQSFARAAQTTLHGADSATGASASSGVRPEDRPALDPWLRFWAVTVNGVFLRAYAAPEAMAAVLPAAREERQALCGIFLLERTVSELEWSLSLRPEVLQARLRALLRVLEAIG